MATQSYRSNGPQGPTTAGPPESSPLRGLPRSLPTTNCLVMGTRAYMTSRNTGRVRMSYSWIGILLFIFLLSHLTAAPAQAEDCVADLGGVVDGFVNPVAPSQIQIDGSCTI